MGACSLEYLGNMINNDNRNDNCVKEGIQAGNRAYFANLRILKIRSYQEQINYKYIKH
jgi:hypothetical protein